MMIDDLDARLDRIASVTMTGKLDRLEHVVLGRIATERRRADSMPRIGAAVVTAALLIGGLGSLDLTAPGHAALPFEALGGANALAPSTLLGGS